MGGKAKQPIVLLNRDYQYVDEYPSIKELTRDFEASNLGGDSLRFLRERYAISYYGYIIMYSKFYQNNNYKLSGMLEGEIKKEITRIKHKKYKKGKEILVIDKDLKILEVHTCTLTKYAANNNINLSTCKSNLHKAFGRVKNHLNQVNIKKKMKFPTYIYRKDYKKL